VKALVLTGICIALLTTRAFSQDLAIIRGEYANITAEKSDSSDLLCQLDSMDVFVIDSVDGNWLAITKPTHAQPLRGFLQKSKSRLLKEMPVDDQRLLIRNIYTTELELVKSENYDERKGHHEPRFDYILDFASRFIVEKKDSELLLTFIETIKLDDGSADEMPSSSLGWIYLKEPEWTIRNLKIVGTDELLVERLESGFDKAVHKKDFSAAQYDELRAKLEALK
jgi:hypothetical protein